MSCAHSKEHAIDLEKQQELRNTYSLIGRGFLALQNTIEALLLTKTTRDPFFDENDEARQKVLVVLDAAAKRAAQTELEALIAEYGPDARYVLE